ncbi:hypothetical protein ACOMHN_016955 [Nucella lapillus]
MEGGAATLNGSHGDDDLMASNGMDDVMKTSSLGMEGADPMTMSGIFSRDLDPQSEGTETSTTTTTSNVSGSAGTGGGDTFGGCGMTDSFILQRDDDFADSSQSSGQPDMLGSCGMTDSFMQLTNGSGMTSVEMTSHQRHHQQSDDAVLIDFSQPPTAAASSSAVTGDMFGDERRLDSQAALFGEDLGDSQEALHTTGYDTGSREPVKQQQQQQQQYDDGTAASDGYHPGQPNTNPFATEGEAFQTDPTSSTSHPTPTTMPAGIDLLIQSAPPPSHLPFPEEEKAPSYNPFMADEEEEEKERGSESSEGRWGSDPSTNRPEMSETNPFAVPLSTTTEPSRLTEQVESGGHSYDLFSGGGGGGGGGGGRGKAEAEEGGESGSPWKATQRDSVEAGREMESDVISAPGYSHMARPEDDGFTQDAGLTSGMPQDLGTQPEPSHDDYLADLEMSAAPGAPRGAEDAFPPSQTQDLMSEDAMETKQETSVEIHPQSETSLASASEERGFEPEIKPEPAAAQPQEEPPKPVATVVPQPAPAPSQIPQPASPKQIKSAAANIKTSKSTDKPAPKSPRKAPTSSPSKSGVPVKTTTTTTTSASRQRPASTASLTSSGSRPASARAAPKKDEATPKSKPSTTPTSRPRTAPAARTSTKNASPSSQAWYRKIVGFGLGDEYKTADSEIGLWLKRYLGLSFLAPAEIQDAVAFDLMDDAPDDPRCTSFSDYILATYAGDEASFAPDYILTTSWRLMQETASRPTAVKNDVSKSTGKSPRTSTISTPSKTASTPGAGSKGGPTTRTPTGASSPASSASGSTGLARKTEARSKIGSLDNATHSPGGGNVKILSKKPDVSNVQSKIGSKDKIAHQPGGGNVKIETKKVEVSTVKSRVGSLDNAKHTPRGGDKKIESKKLDWKVQSKVGSLDNARHTAGGGGKKIEQRKLDWKAQSKIGSLDNATHTPGGGDKKILSEKLIWEADSRIGSLDNAQHVPGGGKKVIETQKLDFKEKASSKVGSMDNATHVPRGGEKQIETQKLDFKEKASSKVGSMDNATHVPGGGEKQIETQKLDFKEKASSKVGSMDNATHVPRGGEKQIETQKLDFKEKASSKVGSMDNATHVPGGGEKQKGWWFRLPCG